MIFALVTFISLFVSPLRSVVWPLYVMWLLYSIFTSFYKPLRIDDTEKKSKYLAIVTKEDIERCLKKEFLLEEFRIELRNFQKKLNLMNDKYTRLKEKLSHSSSSTKLALAEDLLGYIHAINHRVNELLWDSPEVNAAKNDEEYLKRCNEMMEERKKYSIRAEEIEKRFEKLLSD